MEEPRRASTPLQWQDISPGSSLVEEVRIGDVEQTGPECRRGDLWWLQKRQEILQVQKEKRHVLVLEVIRGGELFGFIMFWVVVPHNG